MHIRHQDILVLCRYHKISFAAIVENSIESLRCHAWPFAMPVSGYQYTYSVEKEIAATMKNMLQEIITCTCQTSLA